ncbi:MAG: hydantoinase B/oxoprolinase family protein [Candidatus Aminicenantia bacterium]
MKMFDPVEIEIFRNIFQSICDEMGTVLKKSAFSPNIKERQDYSCALFTPDGESFAFGSHIPVHLGAMPLSVKEALKESSLEDGEMIVLNDPYKGGTHLPDITLIAPFYFEDELIFIVANRAHHSDIGGIKPGSMPLSSEIYQEGIIIPPVKIVRRGEISKDIMSMILSNVRTPEEREGDIIAQIASNQKGIYRLKEVVEKYGVLKSSENAKNLIDYSERLFRSFIDRIPEGIYEFEDYMDDDGFGDEKIPIKVKVEVKKGEIYIDFSESSSQVKGGINANFAVTYSAVLYVMKSVIGEEIPVNSGIMKPIKLILLEGSIVNASKPYAVAGGNVETSQRIVDVLLGAFSRVLPDKIPSASQGTMNNISFGGRDEKGENFAYYETIGGGTGAGPGWNGISGVHSHMTNSLNTPIEGLERYLPIKMRKYLLRKGSGGKGRFRGGDGIIREYEFLVETEVSILSERRRIPPYGLMGGKPGKPGKNMLFKNKKRISLPSKINFKAEKGDILRIETPGGGGFGETF